MTQTSFSQALNWHMIVCKFYIFVSVNFEQCRIHVNHTLFFGLTVKSLGQFHENLPVEVLDTSGLLLARVDWIKPLCFQVTLEQWHLARQQPQRRRRRTPKSQREMHCEWVVFNQVSLLLYVCYSVNWVIEFLLWGCKMRRILGTKTKYNFWVVLAM